MLSLYSIYDLGFNGTFHVQVAERGYVFIA